MRKLSKSTILTLLFIFLALISIIPLYYDSGKTETIKESQKGVFDLTNWEPDTMGNIKLDGEWEFYWNKLLGIESLKNEKPDIYAKVPDFWNTYTIDGEKLGSEGYATYKLHVKTNIPPNTAMALKVNTFSSAYNLYVNDRLIASNGTVGKNKQEEVGEYRPLVAMFYTPSEEFDLIIHVSDFQYERTGFWNSIWMGSSEKILWLDIRDIIKESLIVGALIVSALYYFALYYLKNELKYSLYLALTSLFMALTIDVLGQMIITRIFTGLSFRWTLLIAYTSTTWVFYFVILYIGELYPSRFSSIITKIYFVKAAFFQILYTFTSSSFYSKTADMTNMFDLFVLIGIVIVLAIGIKKGKKDAWLFILAILVLFVAYINDIIFLKSIMGSSFGEMIFVGVFIAIFIQTTVQARKISDYFDKKTAAEIAFMQAQIQPHFLYNSLNTIAELCETESKEAGKLIISLSKYLRGSLDFDNLEEEVSLKKELETTQAYIDIEKARFSNLNVDFLIEPDIFVMMPPLTLQPLVENAIRHGIRKKSDGGYVKLIISKKEKEVLFVVEDDGIGIEQRVIESIKNNQLINESVGLYNINNRLLRLYGKGLKIETEFGKWTRVSFSIPMKGKR